MKHLSLRKAFQMFVLDKQVAGLADKTLESYIYHYNTIVKHIPEDTPLAAITGASIKKVVSELVATGISKNSVRSYTATLQSFFSWCRQNGLSDVVVSLYKGEETVKEIYTREELERLLKRPNLRRCQFPEYRTWVIINLLVNNGLRAATIRSIQIRDVILESSMIMLRHTKNRKAQIIPLSPELRQILAQYMTVRAGSGTDYLFPDAVGNQMSENCLRMAIRNYNRSRGVEKTGIHMFRHTFARMYLVDCGGDALKLQKLLGHSTLKMTQHYVQLYNTDLVKDYETMSPLATFKKLSRIQMPWQKK